MMENNNILSVCLTIRADLVSRFFPLLSTGFKVKAHTVCSIRDLLCRQIGIDEDYLEKRIQTIFLNGKAVDDLDNPCIQNGSVLSLSAAMPGLAGATLRRGGKLATMRAQISQGTGETSHKAQTGEVTLKLFNLTARDIGPFFLRQGILISATDLENLFKNFTHDFQSACRIVEVDNKRLSVDDLFQMDWTRDDVILKIKVDKD